MREIKFRAWDNTGKSWLKDDSVAIELGGRLLYTVDFPKVQTLNDALEDLAREVVLEQFTGLKDKNGKEIYEGDVVKDGKKEPNIGQVFWHQASFRIEWQMRSYDGTRPVEVCTDDCFGYAEVIGNVHENPELLKD